MVLEKEQLEKQKLQLEIKELKKPLIFKPGFLLPLLAALLSILLGQYSGWFDVNMKRLENKRFELEGDITRFTQEKKDIKQKIEQLEGQVKSAENSKAKAQNELEKLKIKSLDQTEYFIAEIKILNSRIERLKMAKDASASSGGKQIIEEQIEVAEGALTSTQSDAIQALDRIKEVFDIPEGTLSEIEGRFKQELWESGALDEDGCLVIDGELHCTNF